MEKEQEGVADFMKDHSIDSCDSPNSPVSSNFSDCEMPYLYDSYGEDLFFLMSSSDEEDEMEENVEHCFSFLNSPPEPQEKDSEPIFNNSKGLWSPDSNAEGQLIKEEISTLDAKSCNGYIGYHTYPIEVLTDVWTRQPAPDDCAFGEAASRNRENRKPVDSNVIVVTQGCEYDNNYVIAGLCEDRQAEEKLKQNCHKQDIQNVHKVSRSVALQEFFTHCRDDQSVVYPKYLEKLKASFNSDELGLIMDLIYTPLDDGPPTACSLTVCNYRKLLQYCKEDCCMFDCWDSLEETPANAQVLSNNDFYNKPSDCSVKRFFQTEKMIPA